MIEPSLMQAIALFRRQELAQARQLCETIRDEATLRGQAGLPLKVRAGYWAARCARRQERPVEALQCLLGALEPAESMGMGAEEVVLRAEVIHVLSSLGQNNDAFEMAEHNLMRARQLQDGTGLAAAQEALAWVHWLTSSWELGIQAYAQALELSSACGDLELRVLSTMGLAASEDGCARAAQSADRRDEAEAGFRRSVALQRESVRLATLLGDEHLVMYSQLNESCSLHSMGALEEAEATLKACIAIPGREAIHGNALATLGQIAMDQGDLAKALGYLQKGLEISERLQKPYPIQLALEQLVDVHEALGDPVAALACMRRYHAMHVNHSSHRARLLAQAISVRQETERALAAAQTERLRAELLERRNADLSAQSARHERAALEDGLTGLANRRCLDEVLEATLGPAGIQPQSCGLALLDLDHFKQINDRFSHQVGDEVLRRVGALLTATCRRSDLAARYGGEELVLLAREAQRDELQQICERLRQVIEQEEWAAIHPGLKVTVSIGVAHSDEVATGGADTAQALLRLADARLYTAKRAGRNRVCATGDVFART